MECSLAETRKLNFSRIYSLYFPKLVRFACEYVVSSEDAENIVQDLFLFLWEHPELTQTLNNINAYLFTLIKNRCIDFLRHKVLTDNRKDSIDNVQNKELQLKMYALQQFDENLLSINDIETLLNNAINNLPEKCREIFILSRMNGLKHKDIAEKMDLSVNTVENHIALAIKKLKIGLKDYLPLFVFII